MNDSQLMDAFYQGQNEAFHELYRSWDGRLRRCLFRRGLCEADVDDGSQRIWMKVFLSRDALPGHGRFDVTREFRPWLFTIAHHVAMDLLATRARFKSLHETATQSGPVCRKEEMFEDMLTCAERLDEREQFFFFNWERGLGELSQGEIAESLEVADATVTRVKKATLAKLAECLEQKGYV